MSISVSEFWNWLNLHQSDLNSLSDPAAPFGQELSGMLKQLDPHLSFELSKESPRDLVFTVNGRRDSIPLVDQLVATSPEIPGWTFIALKQAFGFAFTTTYQGTRFEPQAMWFLDLDHSGIDQIAIRVGLPNFTSTTQTQAQQAIKIVLMKALGERSFATDITHLEVALLPRSPEPAGYIELFELPDVIDEKKRKAV